MVSQPLYSEYKVKSLPASPAANAVYFVKPDSASVAKIYVTDETGTAFPTGDFSTALMATFDNGSSALLVNMQTELFVPFSGRITGWYLMGDRAGSAVVDVWRDSFARFPPTLADSITNGVLPQVTNASAQSSTNVSDWNVIVSKGDVLRPIINSVSSFTRLTLALTIDKT